MPIQFQCPHCQHAMQLPDTAAGKQGKCPKCSKAVTVPSTRAAAPPNPHDEEFWSELDETKATVHHEDEEPKHVTKSDAQLLKMYLGKEKEAERTRKRTGVAWEKKSGGDGPLDRFWDTAIGVINHPTDTFRDMKLSGGYRAPLTYALLGSFAGSFFSALYLLIGHLIQTMDTVGTEDGPSVPTYIIALCAILFLTMFCSVVAGSVGVFLHAILVHMLLNAFKVSKHPYETTFRVLAYCHGSIRLCEIVPALGPGFMAGLLFISITFGLKNTHDIPQKEVPDSLTGSKRQMAQIKAFLANKAWWATFLSNLGFGIIAGIFSLPVVLLFGWLKSTAAG